MAQRPQDFARAIRPLLGDGGWAIGGSTLLAEAGLPLEPRDLDLVCSEAAFPAAYRALATRARDITPPPHPRFATACFARFETPDGPQIELIAGLRIRAGDGVHHHPFRQHAIRWRGGLPWCPLRDWQDMYRQMGREERARQIESLLAGPAADFI